MHRKAYSASRFERERGTLDEVLEQSRKASHKDRLLVGTAQSCMSLCVEAPHHSVSSHAEGRDTAEECGGSKLGRSPLMERFPHRPGILPLQCSQASVSDVHATFILGPDRNQTSAERVDSCRV